LRIEKAEEDWEMMLKGVVSAGGENAESARDHQQEIR
jgi:hypothetical protein